MFILYTFLHVDMSCYLEGHVMIGLASQYTIHSVVHCSYLMKEKW